MLPVVISNPTPFKVSVPVDVSEVALSEVVVVAPRVVVPAVRVPKLLSPDTLRLARSECPETLIPVENTPADVAVRDPPTETLPEELRVVRLVAPRVDAPAFKPARLVKPVTFRPFRAPKPVMEPPTPTFPVVVRVFLNNEAPLTVKVFKSVLPVTAKDALRLTPDVTLKDCPIPTFPEILAEDPIPTKPENLELPTTSRV